MIDGVSVAVLLFDGKAFEPEATTSQSDFAAARACGEERDALAPAVVELLDYALVAVVLVAVGFVVRASLLVQISRTPFFQMAISTARHTTSGPSA